MAKQVAAAGIIFLITWLHCPSLDGQPPADDDGLVLVQSARRMIKEYHREAKQSDNVIRVVYFHSRDRQPLDRWRDRLGRIVEDVSDFYREGLERFGIADCGFSFEQCNEEYVFHLVHGKLPESHYNYESGGAIEREIRTSLNKTIDFERNHVLVLHGLCNRQEDGRYVFNSPYYGRGSQKNGVCHAADCELLDPKLLAQKDHKIVYTEHYYPRKEQTVALFNSWYLGGIAHELGHGLGLPHDAGRSWERSHGGAALMGNGNHHYREELWGGKRPAYLCLGSALRLLSHPLVTKSDHGRFVQVETKLESLSFSSGGRDLKLAGTVQTNVPAYSVIVYLWRPPIWPGNPKNDHMSVSHPALVSKDRFGLHIGDVSPGDYRLRLAVLHCNGSDSEFDFHLKVDPTGKPNIAELSGAWLVARAESAVLARDPSAHEFVDDEAIANAPTAEARAKLRILGGLLNPPALIELTTTNEKKVYLSDAKWISAKVGWGEVARNHFDREKQHRSSIYLELNGKFYDKGLYAHSPSAFVFDLNQRWKTFTATVGLRDGAHKQGSAIFVVRSDGKVLYKSPLLRVGQSGDLRLNVSGVKRLELLADGGEGHVHNSWAIWAAPALVR